VEPPGRLLVEVADTGVGFDAEFAKGLFQRFSQADASITRRFGGSGLGLAISQAIVRMMGGEIEAMSRPGEGSVFRVETPLSVHQGESGVPAGAPEAEDLGRLAGLNVLLAEDHPVNQQVIQLILGPLGVNLTIAENGARAVEAFMEAPFDLVLMDMQMPVMDGLAATRAIRAHEGAEGQGRRTPVAMLSANAMDQHRNAAFEAGADRHIPKPVTAQSLIAGVLAAASVTA
jgi:CheY-like chemotaxis protein